MTTVVLHTLEVLEVRRKVVILEDQPVGAPSYPAQLRPAVPTPAALPRPA